VLDTEEAAKSTARFVVHSSSTTNPNAQIQRSLHFNNRIDLVQSCVNLQEDGTIDRTNPPPFSGTTGTHLQGLGIAAALHARITSQLPAETIPHCQRIVFLGAGACSLPAYLFEKLPHNVAVTAVELSADVCFAARRCFGVDTLEDSADHSRTFKLQQGCAVEWLTEADAGSVDVLIVDIEGDNQSGPQGDTIAPIQLVAPPAFMLSAPFLHSATDALAPDGILAINFIGSESCFADLRSSLPTLLEGLGLFEAAACRAPTMGPRSTLVDAEGGSGASSSTGKVHAIIFVTPAAGPAVLEARNAAEALHKLGDTQIVESPSAWLSGWEQW
jgi:hypothetical protein